MTEDVQIRIKGDANSAVEAFARVRASATSAVTQMQRDTTILSSSFGRLASVVPQVGVVLAAMKVAQMSSQFMEMADAIDEMSERTGVAVEKLAGLEYVGRLNSMSLGDMGTVLGKLNKSISDAGGGNKEKADLFKQLGISARDAGGNLRSAYDVLLDLAGVFPQLDQADQVAVSMNMLGRSGAALAPALAGGRAEMELLIARGQELNPITSDLAKSVAEFNDRIDEVSIQLRSAMVPVLQSAIPWISKMTAELREGVKVFGSFSSAMWAIGTSNPFQSNQDQIAKLKEQLKSMDLSRQVAMNRGASTADIDKRIADARQRLRYFENIEFATNPTAGGGRGFVNPPSVTRAPGMKLENISGIESEKRKAAAEATREANEARRQQRDAYDDRIGQLRTELAEWRNNTDEQRRVATQIANEAKAMFGEESKEYAQAAQELVRIKQRAADHSRQIEADLRASELKSSLVSVELARSEADEQLALGLMTQQQHLALQEQHEQQMTAIKMEALQERLNVLADDPDTNPVERERIYRQIEELELQHVARMGEIKAGKAAEQAGPGGNVMNSMQQSIEAGTTALIMGQQSAMETLRGIWRSTASSFVTEMITKPLAAWVAGQARMTLATILGVNTRTAAEATGAAMSTGITAGSVLKTIGMKSFEAAASVYASIAAIPVVGPFMAPLMAAGAIAAVGSFASKIFSAEGGFDIPAGVNPMVQAHAREMILPAKHADVIRGLADGRLGGGGGDTIQLSVSAMDARSFETWLRGRGGDALVRELSMRKRSMRAG